MTTPSQISPPRNSQQQRGAAMLILVLILMLGLITLFTYRMDRRGPELEADRKTALALAQAKEALLGRAASDNHPGSLPCPDTDDDGATQAFTGINCPSYIGRLPWRDLGLPDLRDGQGERLWYKLSRNFRDHANPINATTTGTLSISGVGAMNGLTAIVFSPGAPLANQVRDLAHMNDLTAYLEGYATAVDLNFNAAPGGPINDRLISISPIEIVNKAVPRVAAEMRDALPSIPYPMMQPTLPSWVNNNLWDITYTWQSNTSAQMTFNSGCATAYQFSWDNANGLTSMTRIGVC